MTSTNTWFITGAGRGMGVEFARAAPAAGHNVVATARNLDSVTEAVGEHEQLLVVKLDITSPQDAEQAVHAAIERFGRIDVLVTTPPTSSPASSRSSRRSRSTPRFRRTWSVR
jgi:NAD(P)-dependent dehydrogenase (short-subunit alcohol dehydrogenase family)